MKIGNIELQNNVALAPMAGVTDLPFRLLCREQGCGLACTEMVSAKAIFYHNKNTAQLIATRPEEAPLAVQLFGSDPAIMAEMAALLADGPYDIIDVNMGCPVPKVVKNGEGSALMRNPRLAAEIIRAMVSRVKKPVTVKFRKGFNDQEVNAVDFAKCMEDAGAAAVAVHGRTREQYYRGKADWDIIRQVKEAVNIPVFGNGDIFQPEDAVRMLRETGCDGVMIARGAKGNPWIFRRTVHLIRTGEQLPLPTKGEVKAMIQQHAAMLAEFKGELTAMREMRSHVAWYTAGFPNSAALRNEVSQVETMEELMGLLEKFAGE
ncbi:tRNA dihydrouridine synthase DusB [Clostridium vitabionis]|uniref:tRNA dihydrouridine synthase DusB n=1 Tax=Clostridium vitabionis TaxID=2784388 RepID=UPI002E2CC727|nr:tRNA dihydrouridine synthase DusB [Clostridium vitabionis]